MKTTHDGLKSIILATALLCGIPHVVFSNEIYQVMSANVDNALSSNAYKKKTRKKKEIEKSEPSRELSSTDDQVQTPFSINSNHDIVAPESIEETSRHRLRVTLMPSFMTVEGEQLNNGSKGILNSRLYTSFRLDYIYVTTHWVFAFTTGFKEIKFENSDDRTLMAPKHKLVRNDLLVGRRFGHLTLGFGAGIEDKFFYKVMNTSFADVETRNDVKAYLWADYGLFKYGNFSASINLKGGVNPSENTDTYDIKTGYFYSGSLKIEHEIFTKKSFGIEMFFKNEDYKTQQLHLKSQEIGLGVSFSYDWGAGK